MNPMRSHGIEVEILNQTRLIDMMGEFIRSSPELWNEDISE
jgi:hypothetical protein